ncbi:hypothetical protein G7054_g1333 [Neopestalotiopsis clavispora]|nr:hypothetical protein G7054_g1333 [Neopestalotiopsis clavispora]
MAFPEDGQDTEDLFIKLILVWISIRYDGIRKERENAHKQAERGHGLKFDINLPMPLSPTHETVCQLSGDKSAKPNHDVRIRWQQYHSISVEIQCRSVETTAEFQSRFLNDCVKINKEAEDTKTAAPMYAIFMTHEIDDIIHDYEDVVEIWYRKVSGHPNPEPIYLLWHRAALESQSPV